MKQPTNFMHEMRSLAPNDKERAEALRIGRTLAQRLREGKLPPLILRLCYRPALLAALLADAQSGNIPDESRPLRRNVSSKRANQRRRHPKQSTVRL